MSYNKAKRNGRIPSYPKTAKENLKINKEKKEKLTNFKIAAAELVVTTKAREEARVPLSPPHRLT